MYSVKIREIKNNGDTWDSCHSTDNIAEAINCAVVKHFGPNSVFFDDSGLGGKSRKYGRILRSDGPDQITSVSIKISEGCDKARPTN
jgi:hypothetical protein